MNHQDAVKLLPWYVNGTLEAEELQLVQGHLRGCFQCKAQLEEWERIGAVLEELGREAPQPPMRIPRRVLEQIRPQVRMDGPRRLDKRPSPPWWRSQWMLQAAAVVLLAGVGIHNLYLRQQLDQLSRPQALPPIQISSEIRASAQVEIPQQAGWIHLQVEVPPIPLDRSYSELGYKIVSAQGQQVLSGTAGVGERLDLFLPAARMDAGRYTLVLTGTEGNRTDEVSTYGIDLQRK